MPMKSSEAAGEKVNVVSVLKELSEKVVHPSLSEPAINPPSSYAMGVTPMGKLKFKRIKKPVEEGGNGEKDVTSNFGMNSVDKSRKRKAMKRGNKVVMMDTDDGERQVKPVSSVLLLLAK